MGTLTAHQPKCMTKISKHESILSRQLNQLANAGIEEIVITTGAFGEELRQHCDEFKGALKIFFADNPEYQNTNYIYSIYCAREYLNDDILLLHGDLVFENEVLNRLLDAQESSMVVSSTQPLPYKDFKATVRDGKIFSVGVNFFADAVAAQPFYKLFKNDWLRWLREIEKFCAEDNRKCYAEDALNKVTKNFTLRPLDIHELFCREIDDEKDLSEVTLKLREIEQRTVYMSFSTDILHSGHIAIIKKARQFGRLIIGVLSDEAVASYKRLPILSLEERKSLFQNIKGVFRVVEQKTLSYRENLEKYRPNFVVHGDDWQSGVQKPVRDEVADVLSSYGGRLIEFPYSKDEKHLLLDKRSRQEFSLPDMRRGILKKILDVKKFVTAIETHNGLTGLLAEKATVYKNGVAQQFDAFWISSLCDSTAKGKPDIELVDMTSRFNTVNEIMEVTTKPIIFDGDTGGLKEHFAYTVRTLERMGVSMIIIEDKVGLKKNSLFGTEVNQAQDTIENFCRKIAAGKSAQRTKDFMICARIESLILEKGIEDALERARAFVEAGADAVMIHSRKNSPTEIFEFVDGFRAENLFTPLVVVPTAFPQVREEEFKARGVNIVIYANHLTRSSFPAMQRAAESILENHRALECEKLCMPFKEIIRLIPEGE